VLFFDFGVLPLIKATAHGRGSLLPARSAVADLVKEAEKYVSAHSVLLSKCKAARPEFA
jgi:hypothetical protein